MNSPVAHVLSVAGDSATVSVDSAIDCPRCRAGKGCGAGLIGSTGAAKRRLDVPVRPGLTLNAGDRVRLSLHPSRLLKAAVVVYGAPLGGIVGALALATWYFDALSDPGAVIVAALGFAVGVMASRRRLQRDNCIEDFIPEVAERLEPGEPVMIQDG